MKKFFLFRKEAVSVSSVAESDTGLGLSVLALPADSLAFASADRGHVVLCFNGAGKYEESNLTDGESMEKTTVRIPCEEGKEVELIEAILGFISREGGKTVMKFDDVDGESTFSIVTYNEDILSKVRVNPTQRVTNEISKQSFIGTTGTVGADPVDNTIAGIDFQASLNKPIVDYNHEGLASKADGAEINSWDNAGTGGNTYDIGSNVGAPTKKDGGGFAKAALSKDYADFAEADHFIIPTLTVAEDYTLYVVFSYDAAFSVNPMYGSADSITLGPFMSLRFTDGSSAGEIDRVGANAKGNFCVRHSERTGFPPNEVTDGDVPETDTVSFSFPKLGNLTEGYDVQLNVIVIRRDRDFNLYMYNRNGDLISFIINNLKGTTATDGRTDGDLVIERLGTFGDIVTNSFDGNIARFGVIDHDIGVVNSIKLAQDLYNLYKL